MTTLQDKFKELCEQDTEIPCWLDNILSMHQDWLMVMKTHAKLLVAGASESTLEEVHDLQTELYKEWKEQEDMFLEEMNEKIPLDKYNLNIQGYTEFDRLEYEVSKTWKTLYLIFKPKSVDASGWNASLSDTIILNENGN